MIRERKKIIGKERNQDNRLREKMKMTKNEPTRERKKKETNKQRKKETKKERKKEHGKQACRH
jgi:hypothetical protein